MRKISILIPLTIIGVVVALIMMGRTRRFSEIPDDVYRSWMDTVGAFIEPVENGVFYTANNFGAKGDGVTLCTQAIQKAIDEAEKMGGGTVSFEPGMYVTGSIFVGNNVNLVIPHGVTILGSEDINDYKRIDTRVAGIEMKWPAGIINIVGKRNASISGYGTLDGRGRVHWEKYFAMREEYNPKGLRWAVDYDCERPQGIIVQDCNNVSVSGIAMYRLGFWSLHVLYSQNVTIDNLIICNNIEMRGPSTDGIDIDSSSSILVMNCYIQCNDDNFCLKAGRDADGLRVNRPCEYVMFYNCTAGHGDGLLTCGSETSGGIRHIVAYNMDGFGTKYGLRFKSTSTRGGVIEDINISNIRMDSVGTPIILDLNWHPSYNAIKLEGDIDSIPAHWKTMMQPVDSALGIPKFRDIKFNNVTASHAKKCIKMKGMENSTMDNFVFKNVKLEGAEKGEVEWQKDWTIEGLEVNGEEMKF